MATRAPLPVLAVFGLCLLGVGSTAFAKPKPPKAAKVKKEGTGKKGVDLKLKPSSEPAAEAQNGPLPSRGPARIDFDDRLIQGQTNKSGAVYLYERKELRTNSMLKTPETFRRETVETVFGG